MTDKLPPLEPPLSGQDARLYLESEAECSAGHWYSPKLVADYIAEAKHELLTAIAEPNWVFLDGMNTDELAAYDYGGNSALQAVSRIIPGAGPIPMTWESVRARLVALVAERAELKALLAKPKVATVIAQAGKDDADWENRKRKAGELALHIEAQAELNRRMDEWIAAGSKPLASLTDEQIDALVPGCLTPHGNHLNYEPFARAVIAAHCRINGLTETKP